MFNIPGDEVHGDPEPVGDGGAVAFRNQLTPQASDGRKIESDRRLEDQERDKGDDPKN